MLTYAQKLCRTACARSAADEEHARQLEDQHQIRFITPRHEEWLEQLNDLHPLDLGEAGGVPIALWARGVLAADRGAQLVLVAASGLDVLPCDVVNAV